MLKSYYEILNICENASKDEIKKQFKKLVKMYHPDINSSLEAENIFKKINKAAEILLDDEKRKNYDKLRNTNKEVYNKKPHQNYKTSESSGYSFYDIFKKTENKKTKKPKKGSDITVNVEIDYQEALLGTYRSVNIAKSSICPKCLGKKFANGQNCSYCNGLGEKTLNKKITVKIPPKIKDKTKLRLKQEGSEGEFNGQPGDLYIVVNITKKDDLTVKDGIVYNEVEISPYTAVLGGNIKVPTLWGEAVIKIPPLTKSNQSFKLIDVGVLNEKTNKKGEQITKVIIQIPSEISNDEYKLYEKLKEINSKKKNAQSI